MPTKPDQVFPNQNLHGENFSELDFPNEDFLGQNFIDAVLPAVRQAGAAIMDVYHTDFEAVRKSDGSPVTEADKRAEAILLPAITAAAPDMLIISEENEASHKTAPADLFCLVDPLDGTKEFLKQDGKGSFTVNIGIINHGIPVAGIVLAPALDKLYTAIVGHGAYLNGTEISVRGLDQPQIAVASSSHRDEATNDWLTKAGISETMSIGSSLKFCLVAEGQADVYPRFGPTMEWDTAAGHAILRAAGGEIYHPDGTLFTYGKPEYRNGPFIAEGK